MKEKRCPKCGEKTTEKICPKCKTRLKSGHHTVVLIVMILIIILLACLFIVPHHTNSNMTSNQTSDANKNVTSNQTANASNMTQSQSDDTEKTIYQSDDYNAFTQYREISTDDAVNPPVREKVQFDGKYIGQTDWTGSGNDVEYMPPPTYTLIQYGGAYVFLEISYKIPNLNKYENNTIHLEGEFDGGNTLDGHTDNGYVAGNLFHPDKIVVKS